ncbi:MAG: 6-carboxy-5,6,7,8-tetrahydropterin synthase [Gammaproteobacteria bacterium]|nr:6-carboxy-5,6,7,8-tetrahydropterin synthase [Gammaproteobacteria bacterium]
MFEIGGRKRWYNLMELYKVFTIEAAHLLPNLPDNHKCKRLHGHSFRIEVHVTGPVDEHLGWVMDFADIGTHIKPVFETLDHRFLNDINGLENPTSENLARWIWQKLKPQLAELSSIVVGETCTSGCIYRGEGNR